MPLQIANPVAIGTDFWHTGSRAAWHSSAV